MILTSEKNDRVKDYIKKKVQVFQKSQEELEIKEEELELLISSLIEGQIKDLGGLIALRGFVYQYYVTINYMIDMLHSGGAWWDAVAFELLDDIALIKDTGIRFVQVKTGREDGKHRIKPGDLYSRDKELNSWLDKIFLNIPYYDQELENAGHGLKIVEGFRVEFEIATNYPPEHNSFLEPYFMNSNFDFPDHKRHQKDVLLEKLQKPQDIYEIKEKKTVKIGTKYLADEIAPFSIQWCLNRLYINSFGYFLNLEKTIKGKIQDILDENNSMLSSAISEDILQNLLAMVVSRTHDDSPNINKSDLIFTKDELKKQFTIWRKEAEVRIYEAAKQKVLLAKFDSCVWELRDSIKRTWQGATQKDILDNLDWIYMQLSERFKQIGDIDVYEKFLNRLFEMRNHNLPISLEPTGERQHLINSLKFMSICLSFYTEHNFPYEDSNLLIKKGIFSDEDYMTFATFNARQQFEFDEAKRRVVHTVIKCPETQKIHEDFYCFIVDALESLDPETDPFASLGGISSVNIEKKITDVPSNVYFVNPKEVQPIFNSLRKKPGLDFQNPMVREKWNETIERNKTGDDIQ